MNSEMRSPDELKRHEEHKQIYGEITISDWLVEDIAENGIRDRLIILPDNTVISGWRLRQHSLKAGVDEIQITVKEYEYEWQEREAIVANNQQRNKTFSQRMREAEVLEEVEKRRATQRQGTRTDLAPDSAEGDWGETAEKVGRSVGIGGSTKYRNAKAIWKAAHEDDESVMQREINAIDSGDQSVGGAYERWTGIQKRREQQKQSQGTNGGEGDDASNEGDDNSDDDPQQNEGDWREQRSHETKEEWIIRLADQYCRYFSAGSTPYQYPLRLQHASKPNRRVCEGADDLIMDSDIENENVSNGHILTQAVEYGANFVIPKDYKEQPERTTESVCEFLDLYAGHECDATVMIPLQPDSETGATHVEHYDQLLSLDGHDFGSHTYFGVSVRDESVEEGIEIIRQTRDRLGPDKHIHALGMGPHVEFAEAVYNDPDLVDSADSSSIDQMAIFDGSLGPDADGNWCDYRVGSGDGRGIIEGGLISRSYYEYNRRMAGMGEYGDELVEEPEVEQPQSDNSARLGLVAF